PYVWVESGQVDAVVATLDRSSVTEEVEVVHEADGETLLRVEWASKVNGVFGAIEASEGVILEGTGSSEEGWTLRLRFPDRTGLSEFYRTCTREGISLDLKEVHGLHSGHDTEAGLTAEQHDAIRLALERGYFAVPRRITLIELANELGISDTAASQRLRRGLNSLLSATLGTEMAERD
ncbi:MAG: helix-turn-helix domain-containing protein, partial [Halobacteriales archaeon]|nr:helix-turn-helix domain-containing protein [Halobacteriales archaeon]